MDNLFNPVAVLGLEFSGMLVVESLRWWPIVLALFMILRAGIARGMMGVVGFSNVLGVVSCRVYLRRSVERIGTMGESSAGLFGLLPLEGEKGCEGDFA